MANASVVTAQTDFSAGEVDVTLKRDHDNEILRKGARQMANWRLLNSKKPQNRSGRRALFLATGRTEEVQMAPGVVFFLNFGNGTLKVFDQTGTQVFTEAGRPWTLATLGNVVWAVYQSSIYIAFTTGKLRVLTFDGVSAWTPADFAETVTAGGKKLTPFYRLSPKNVTMLPAAQTGVGVAVTFSAGMNLVAGHVGTRMRFVNRQLLITAVGSPTTATVTIEEPLPGSQTLTFLVDPSTTYAVGDVVIGSVTNSRGVITSIDPAFLLIQVQLLTTSSTAQISGSIAFTTSDTVVGPSGGLKTSAVSVIANPLAIAVWDDEVMNDFRGYPASVAIDQNRLILSNFPSVPAGIAWSALGDTNNLYVGANPGDPMFELAPNKAQVFYVVAGAESSEFVFTGNGVYYIPISATNPLKPGSVQFQLVSTDAVRQIQPRAVEEAIVFMTSKISVKAIMAIGAYYRPYKTYDVSELHNHLFNAPVAIAAPTQEGTFPERYVYVLNGDGTVAVGKYTIEQGALKGAPGWLPWSGNGTPSWLAAFASDVIFTNSYAPNGITPVTLVEILDDTRYLDASQKYTTQPTGLPIPGGKGPLWWLANGSVDLMDGPAGTRMMGTYRIDANGFLIPQGNAGENFASANLVCGQAWTATLEPFIPPVQPGQDMSQRMWPRRVQRVQSYVQNSSGFVMARLYSDESGPSLPAAGTIMKQRRIATWNIDEDPTQPPPLREQSYLDRPLGRSHDPRWALIKDTPGPIAVLEITTEVTV